MCGLLHIVPLTNIQRVIYLHHSAVRAIKQNCSRRRIQSDNRKRFTMLSRKPTTIRKTRRRSNSRHTTRRCSAPTVLGPPASLALFKSDSNLASMLSLTPQASCSNVHQLSSSSRSISFRLPTRISESTSLTTVTEVR